MNASVGASTATRARSADLAIETSGRVGSVVLGRAGALLGEAEFVASHNHGVELLPAVSRLCAAAGVSPADIGRVDVSCGPGSFTGLRVGVTFAKMLAFARGARLVRVPTLDVIAQNALMVDRPPDRVAVVLDAKRQRVYACAYDLDQDRYVARGGPVECDPTTWLEPLSPVVVLGEGTRYHKEAIGWVAGATILSEHYHRPHARVVYRLGEALARAGGYTDGDAMLPVYVRLPEAEEKWRARQQEVS